MLPVMSNEFGVVAGVTQFNTVDADCVAVGCVTRMTPVHTMAEFSSLSSQNLIVLSIEITLYCTFNIIIYHRK